MKTASPYIKPISRLGLHIQGYSCFADKQLAHYAFGIRFAYLMCGVLVLLGLIAKSRSFYYLAWTISIGGMLLPRNPVDYAYNAIIPYLFKKPAIPIRSRQNRFACLLATAWLAGMIGFSLVGFSVTTAAMAGAMLMQVVIVTSTDICFASVIYNFLIKYL